jgi:hypothetical protein
MVARVRRRFRAGARSVLAILDQFDCGRLTLENGRLKAHISWMTTIVQCNCGAEYRRTEEKFLVPHTGDAVCTVCGAALESWWESTHVPTYELIERPDRKPE